MKSEISYSGVLINFVGGELAILWADVGGTFRMSFDSEGLLILNGERLRVLSYDIEFMFKFYFLQ
jgi:hypothetical protein